MPQGSQNTAWELISIKEYFLLYPQILSPNPTIPGPPKRSDVRVNTHPKCYVKRQEPLPGGPKTGLRFLTLMNSRRLVRRTSVLSQNPLLQLWAILTKGATGKSPEALDCQHRLEFSPLVPRVLPSSLRSTATRIAQSHSGPMEMTTCPQI